MSRKWTPKELLYDLVSIQSDSFTAQEIQISRHIFELIQEQDYWKEHPDLCGLYDGGDVIGGSSHGSAPGKYRQDHYTDRSYGLR